MKKTTLLLWFFLSAIVSQAQLAEGTYREGSDSLCLKDRHASFRISGFAGLSVAQVGEGDYEMLDDIVIIRTAAYSGHKSSSRILPASRNDSCVVEVIGRNGYPLSPILVESFSKSGKLLEGKVTTQDGKVYFTETEKIGSIKVSAMGFHNHTIQFEPDTDLQVQLAENEVIENREVVFRYQIIDEETISLLMLSDDFKAGKNRERDLEKLLKKARRSNRIDKRMKKVYVPFVRKI